MHVNIYIATMKSSRPGRGSYAFMNRIRAIVWAWVWVVMGLFANGTTAQAQADIRCSGANLVNWTTVTASSAVGSLTALDGTPISVTGTGSMLALGSPTSSQAAYDPYTNKANSVNLDNAAEPQVTGTGPFLYTWTFSQAVTNPFMNIFSLGNAGVKIRYTFKDGAGNPVNFTIRKTDNNQTFYASAANQLEGNEGNGTIQFQGAISTLRIEVTYLSGSTSEVFTAVTFGVRCPDVSFAPCPAPTIVDWQSNTAGQAIGTVTDNVSGNPVSVTLTGSIVNIGFPGEFNNTTNWDINSTAGERVAIDNAAEPQVTGTGPFLYTWTLSSPLRQPIFNISSLGSTSIRVRYTFFDENNEPLTFIVRKTNDWEAFRQLSGHVLEGAEGNGTIQFDGSPKQIRMQVTYITGSTAENFTSIQLVGSCPAPEPQDGINGKCNGANFAKWTNVSPNSVVGTIMDITGKGSSIVGAGSMININYTGYFNNASAYYLPARYADRVAIDNAAEPQNSGTGPFLYTWTISNPISNLLMYVYSLGQAGKRVRYTFTDASGNPIPFTVLKTDNATNFAKVGSNQLEGEEGNGTIRFDVPVTVIRMETTYLTGNTSEFWTGLTFGVLCPEAQVQDCPTPRFAAWSTTATASQATATMPDAQGNTVNVTLKGSIINTGFPNEFTNTAIWNPVQANSNRVAIDNAAEPQVTGTGPFSYSLTFSSTVKDPILNIYSLGSAGAQVKYTFTDAAGSPLQFCVRKTDSWETFHQIDGHVLIGQEGNGSIQLLGTLSDVRIGVTYLTGSTAEFYTTIQLCNNCSTPTLPPSLTINSPNNVVVNTTNPPISGTATAGASVTVSGPNGQSCVTTASAAGSWTCTSLTFTPGSQTVTAVASNTVGTSTVAVTSFTVANPCSNSSVGGAASYSGVSLCSSSNAGTVQLAGQTGAVVTWQTSTNGGTSWTDINASSGKITYNFLNAASGQQFRAVVSNGNGCADAFSAPATVSTSSSVCSTTACDNQAGTITITATSSMTGSNYSHQVIATDANGTILYVSGTSSKTITGVATGSYLVYLLSYENTVTPQPSITVGTNITAVGGACAAISNQLVYGVCNCPTPSVGGTVTLLGTLPLCSVSNQGVLQLAGQTGAVVKWQTSTNGGTSWTDIGNTAGLTQISFTNAANGQQFRAVVNSGGSCADAFSTALTTTTSSSACSTDCVVKPGGIVK
ncbi:hypothetical protein [Spirosoma sp. 209]|uniref:hypothetical protein n=1 Tax=Spirosoma sp. 209 TaxID=1955701 RepID=UPI00098D3CD8|nr:hypothetical protein [Spirosoma sp. 209]